MSLEQIRAVALGHAVADALGVPAEFMSRTELKKTPVTGMRGGGVHAQKAGTWSDDTSMALCAMDALARGEGALRRRDLIEELCRDLARGR